MEYLLWPLIWITLNLAAILTNLHHLESERERHRQLVNEYNRIKRLWEQGDRTLDALSQNFEDSARRIEDRERVMKQQLAARAEQLIVMKMAKGRNGSFEIARLFVTETDIAFLRGRPGLWPGFIEAIKDVSESWFYRTITAGVA